MEPHSVSRPHENIQALSPIPIVRNEQQTTQSTNFLQKRKVNILDTISKLEDLGQVDGVKTLTNFETQAPSRAMAQNGISKEYSRFKTDVHLNVDLDNQYQSLSYQN